MTDPDEAEKIARKLERLARLPLPNAGWARFLKRAAAFVRDLGAIYRTAAQHSLIQMDDPAVYRGDPPPLPPELASSWDPSKG